MEKLDILLFLKLIDIYFNNCIFIFFSVCKKNQSLNVSLLKYNSNTILLVYPLTYTWAIASVIWWLLDIQVGECSATVALCKNQPMLKRKYWFSCFISKSWPFCCFTFNNIAKSNAYAQWLPDFNFFHKNLVK